MKKTLFLDGLRTIPLSGLSLDSRKIDEGEMFIACAGVQSHGIAYAGDAINHGAAAIAWEPSSEMTQMPDQVDITGEAPVPLYKVENLSNKLTQLAEQYYGNPSRQMKVVGVTGTNGKTSVSHFIAQCLQSLQIPAGIIGTLGYGLLDKFKPATHTTPDVISNYKYISDFYQQGIKHVIMEVSSHALDQDRVAGIDFDIAVFTNLSRDHLDYHKDMENYAQAKRRLFLRKELNSVVINADEPEGKFLLNNKYAKDISIIAYSSDNSKELKKSDIAISAKEIKLSGHGMSFELSLSGNKDTIKLPLIGRFNLDNVLACVGVLAAMKYSFQDIVNMLKHIRPVSGRMQLLQTDNLQKPQVIVDYAHTPDALEKALQTIKMHCQGQLCCVFGCGGDRDKGKRSLMANAASRYADKIIITSDNPRSEDPMAIIADIEQGILHSNYQIEVDRKLAITNAIRQAKPEDMILVAGKGHEDYQEVKGIRHHLSDIEIGTEALAA